MKTQLYTILHNFKELHTNLQKKINFHKILQNFTKQTVHNFTKQLHTTVQNLTQLYTTFQKLFSYIRIKKL